MGGRAAVPSPPFLIPGDVSPNPSELFLGLNLEINPVLFAALALFPLSWGCSGGSHSDPRLWQRAEVTLGDTVSVTRSWEGPGQTQGTLLPSDFSQTLLELRQRQSCAPGALAAVAAGHGATRDGERVAVGHGGVQGRIPAVG